MSGVRADENSDGRATNSQRTQTAFLLWRHAAPATAPSTETTRALVISVDGAVPEATAVVIELFFDGTVDGLFAMVENSRR